MNILVGTFQTRDIDDNTCDIFSLSQPNLSCCILSIFQLILQGSAALACEFIRYQAPPSLPDRSSRTIGLFTDYDVKDNECPKQLRDDKKGILAEDFCYVTAQTMLILSLIGALTAGCMVTVEIFCHRQRWTLIITNVAYLICIVTGAAIFMAYFNPYCDIFTENADLEENTFDEDAEFQNNDELFECTVGQGSIYNACAVVIYSIAMITLFFAPEMPDK